MRVPCFITGLHQGNKIPIYATIRREGNLIIFDLQSYEIQIEAGIMSEVMKELEND